MFVDYTKVTVKSGRGGDGAVAFRKEKHVPKGGPAGGHGGDGGDVFIKADPSLWTLQDVKYRKKYEAENGENGAGNKRAGKDGESVTINVPIGTIVKEQKSKQILADISKEGQKEKIAKGGEGGLGNSAFATSTNRAPREAESGEPGETKQLIFELKIPSDVGLVGLPNAGKSTLISKLSNAKPKVADYPFTTLVPHPGIVKYGEYKSFLLADVPGLIENAHRGKGLGDRFLRHLERAQVLVYLIESIDETPEETYELLKNELYQHSEIFKTKPELVVFSKSDLVEEEDFDFEKEVTTISVSSVTGEGLDKFIDKVTDLIEE